MVQEKLTTSGRKLGSTRSRLKQQAAVMKGGHQYHEYTYKQQMDTNPYRLPRVRQQKPTKKTAKL